MDTRIRDYLIVLFYSYGRTGKYQDDGRLTKRDIACLFDLDESVIEHTIQFELSFTREWKLSNKLEAYFRESKVTSAEVEAYIKNNLARFFYDNTLLSREDSQVPLAE